MNKPKHKREYLVTENAKLDCSFGASFGYFLSSSKENSGLIINGRRSILETHIEISGFTFCSLTREKCEYDPLGNWQVSCVTMLSDKKAVLSANSCLNCIKGGIITIADPGQYNTDGRCEFTDET